MSTSFGVAAVLILQESKSPAFSLDFRPNWRLRPLILKWSDTLKIYKVFRECC